MLIQPKNILFFTLLCVPLFENSYAAENFIGKITNIHGLCSVVSENNSKRDLFKDDLIYVSERLETVNDAKLHLETTTHQLITLDKNSSLLIDKYVFDQKNPELSQIFLTLHSGSIHLDTTTREQSFGSLQLAIRKVVLESSYANFGVSTATDSTLISVKLGNVRLLNHSDTPLIIHAGQTFELIDQQPPIPSSKVIDLLSVQLENNIKTNTNSNRPRLENFSSYGKFLQALYLYRKAEEELRKAPIIVPDLPSEQTLSYTLINGGYEVINWGENLSNLELSNDQLNAMDLVTQQSNMTAMKASEMELAAIKNILGFNFISILDILDIKQADLDKILTKELNETTTTQKNSEIQARLLKYNIKNNSSGTDLIILGTDIGQTEVTTTSRMTP